MNIVVILCTYNRCQSLSKALESLGVSSMPETDNWRVCVVDNNSTDQTRTLVEDFARRFPGRFEYLFEARQGKSHALNLGIQKSNADVLAFVDDDVQVDRDWLRNITAPLRSARWSGSGGRILPEHGFIAPEWLDTRGRYSMAPLAVFDLAKPAGKMDESPFGANMAYRCEMFSKHGGFRLDLGPQPGGEIKNEDVEFGTRLVDAGEQIWYEPAAIVYHAVPRHRVRKSYFLMWWFGKGRSDTRQSKTDLDCMSLCGVPLVLFRRLAVWSTRWFLGIEPSQRFAAKVKVWWLAGRIREAFGQFLSGGRVRIPQSEITQ